MVFQWVDLVVPAGRWVIEQVIGQGELADGCRLEPSKKDGRAELKTSRPISPSGGFDDGIDNRRSEEADRSSDDGRRKSIQ